MSGTDFEQRFGPPAGASASMGKAGMEQGPLCYTHPEVEQCPLARYEGALVRRAVPGSSSRRAERIAR
jgi:hypothetical protein